MMLGIEFIGILTSCTTHALCRFTPTPQSTHYCRPLRYLLDIACCCWLLLVVVVVVVGYCLLVIVCCWWFVFVCHCCYSCLVLFLFARHLPLILVCFCYCCC